jgi:hypothetical protein
MSRQFHGVTSLGLAALAIVIAAITLFQNSLVLGVIYLAACGIGGWTVVYAYCSKCTCKANCAHVLPGKAALIYNRQPGPYTKTEIAALILALLPIIALPQFWLWQSKSLFIIYWLLIAIALIQVRTVICRSCDNTHCPLNNNQSPIPNTQSPTPGERK